MRISFINTRSNFSLFVMIFITYHGFIHGQLDNTQRMTKSGTTAAQFLKIGIDARATAMGNAFTAMDGDISSMFWNVAGLANLKRSETMFVKNDWLSGTDFQYIGFAIPLRDLGVIGFGITSLNVPDDKVRTVTDPEGTGEYWGAQDLSANISFARKLTDKFNIGGNIKLIQQRIWHSNASTFALDLGALFITPFKGVRLGVSLSNYGGELRMTGRDQKLSVDPDPVNQGNVEFVNSLYETDAFPLPLMFRVGLSGELLRTDVLRLSYGVDAFHPNDNSEAVNTGLELAVGEMFFLRGGHANLFRENAEEGFTLGGGFHYRSRATKTTLRIDYSYVDFGLLKYVNRVSIGIIL